MTKADIDHNHIIGPALGRIFRMGARPTQPGDITEYKRCRAIILNELDEGRMPYAPNWVRDRMKGAQGD